MIANTILIKCNTPNISLSPAITPESCLCAGYYPSSCLRRKFQGHRGEDNKTEKIHKMNLSLFRSCITFQCSFIPGVCVHVLEWCGWFNMLVAFILVAL